MTLLRPFFAKGDLLVFALALAVRLLHVHFVETADPWAHAPIIDEASYDRAAQRIAAGEWLGTEVFFQDPLYPYALGGIYALLGRSLLAVRILQALLDAASAATIGALARRLGGRAAGWLAGALAALYAPFLYFVGQLDKATFVVAATTAFLSTWTLAREGESRWRWFGAGLALGCACLLRGNFLGFVPLVPLLLGLERRRAAIRPILAFAGGLLAVLAPVATRNSLVGGEFVLTTAQGGTNFYIGNCARNPNGVSISLPFVRTIPEHEADDWRREAERRVGGSLARGEVSRFWTREALREMGEDPAGALRRFGRKGAIALNDYEVPDNHSFEYAREFSPTLRIPVRFALVLALGGAALLAHSRASAFRPLQVLFFGYLGTLVATVTADRIRIPLAVPLLVAAGTSLPWFAAARGGRRALGLLAAAALFLQARLPAFPPEQVENKRFQARLSHALLLAREGRMEEAERLARSILERYRDDPNVTLFLAEIERHRGMAARDAAEEARRYAEAEQLVREKVLPRAGAAGDRALRHKADLALGWLSLLQGKNEEAVGHFTDALDFDPEDVDAANLLANALGNLGRFGEAESVLGRAIRSEPSRWLTWDTLGLVRLRRGDRPGAAAAARRVVELGGKPSATLRPLLAPGN
ncbi:MAG TPA: glycosyltransferase family 39 protein [Planctomycetota bacterium]|nr:glycosyltransferase family 39 protein [Planctomycetota bacterium]